MTYILTMVTAEGEIAKRDFASFGGAACYLADLFGLAICLADLHWQAACGAGYMGNVCGVSVTLTRIRH